MQASHRVFAPLLQGDPLGIIYLSESFTQRKPVTKQKHLLKGSSAPRVATRQLSLWNQEPPRSTFRVPLSGPFGFLEGERE